MLNSALFEKFGIEFTSGETIFYEFEPGNDFYLIQSGKIKITKVVKNKEKTMDILTAGDIFGEMAILEEQPRSASAVALDNVSVLHFNRENFVSLMTSQPQLAYKLLTIFTKRIYDAKRRLMILLLEDTQAKVADVFLMLSEKESNSENLREIILPVTIDDVAHWAGEPVDKVQDVINHWVKMGKIDLYTDKMVISNMSDLRRLVTAKRKGLDH